MYRRDYPGESKGITEEMRFVAMRVRNLKGKKYPSSQTSSSNSDTDEDSSNDDVEQGGEGGKQDCGGETWKPSMEVFVKYLVDSQLVFNTIERIVDESSDVACNHWTRDEKKYKSLKEAAK